MQREPNIHRELHALVQGTPAWDAYRANHDNASDAPAMMSCSPYKTRSELIRQYATGLSPEIDARTQKLFDDGHRFEALARDRVAELDLVGMELYPNIASLGRLSASFDGLTMCETIVWEHKSLNNDIRASETAADLPLMYRVQMEQQMHIVGAEKALFSATRWDDNDNLVGEKHFWYEPDMALRQQIIYGWEQFALDVAAYVPVEVVEPVKAAPIADLPVVTVQVRGELTMCNLADLRPAYDNFLAGAKIILKTDDDFALAKEQSKVARSAAKHCLTQAKAVVDQMRTVAEVTRELEEYAGKFNALALRQEKAVKDEELAIKTSAKLDREKSYTDLIADLNAELFPLRLIVADQDKPQFTEVMKNQRTLASLYNKLDAELARVKIAANQVATDIRAKLAWMKSAHAEYDALFPPVLLQQMVAKPMDDFQLVVTTRIAAHQAAEKVKEDAMRAQIAAQEQEKAEAAAAATLAAERKADADRQAAEQARVAAESKRQLEAQQAAIAEQAANDRAAAALAEQNRLAAITADQQRTARASAANMAADALAEQGRLTDLADEQPVPADLLPVSIEVRETAPAGLPTLRLGQINERIAPLQISAEGLRALGFAPAATDKAAKLFHEADFSSMCAALCRHIGAAQAAYAI